MAHRFLDLKPLFGNSIHGGMDRNQWHFYAHLFSGFERSLLASTFGAVCAACLLLVIPWLVRFAFNEVIPEQRYGILVLIALLALGIQGAYLGLSLWVKRTVFMISKEVTKTLRRDAVKKLYSLSDRTYSHLNRGGLHAKYIIDIDRVDQMTEGLIGSLLPSLIVGTLLLAGMLVVSWPLLLLALMVFACFVPVTRLGRQPPQAARPAISKLRAKLQFQA